MSKFAFLFPGQGAQYSGMGRDFAETFSEAKETFEEADDLLKMHLSHFIFNGPDDVLKQTLYSQLGIFVVSQAILRTLRRQTPCVSPIVCAGLSLGEYTALCASGKLAFKDALFVVQERARLMNDACEITSGSMAAVLGVDAEEVEKNVQDIEGVWVANYNGPGQVVISGTKQGLEIAQKELKAKGAKRLIPLAVQGAFHSGLMRSAQEGLAPLIMSLPLVQTDIDLVMNVSGDFVKSLGEIQKNLISQVTHSVRWQQSIQAIEGRVDLFFEIGCGKTLTGLNKKMGVGIPTLSIERIEDLEQVEHILCSSC